METTSIQTDTEQSTSSIFFTFNSTYIYSLVPIGLNISGSLNLQRDIGSAATTSIISPVFAIGKPYFNKKLYINLALAYNSVVSSVKGNTINARVTARYLLNDAHNFQLSLITVSRVKYVETVNRNQELTATLGYNYTF